MVELPFFSVIVPTHKRSLLLRRALQSIKSQNSPALVEVIVISDAIDPLTDNTCADLLEQTDVYIRRNGKPGPSESRNLAMSIASGTYILFLDDDDAWHADYLAQLYASPLIRSGSAVYCSCSVAKERRLPEGPEQVSENELDLSSALTEDVYVKNQVHMSCFAFPKGQLAGLLFDTSMRAYEDWEFLLSVFDRQLPKHVPILGSRVFEVSDDTSDRRGNSKEATDLNAVFDYLYTYRRHPAPNEALRQKRSSLMMNCGIHITPEML